MMSATTLTVDKTEPIKIKAQNGVLIFVQLLSSSNKQTEKLGKRSRDNKSDGCRLNFHEYWEKYRRELHKRNDELPSEHCKSTPLLEKTPNDWHNLCPEIKKITKKKSIECNSKSILMKDSCIDEFQEYLESINTQRERCRKYWENLSPEQREKLKQRRCEWWRNISFEKRGELKQRKCKNKLIKEQTEQMKRIKWMHAYHSNLEERENNKQISVCNKIWKCKLSTEKQRESNCEKLKKLNSKEQEIVKQKRCEYSKEVKTELHLKQNKYYKNLSPEKKKVRARENYRLLNIKEKKEMKQNVKKILSPEKKKKLRQKYGEYYKKLSPEKKKELHQKRQENCKKSKQKMCNNSYKMSNFNKSRKEQNLDYEGNLRRSARLKKETVIQERCRDMRPRQLNYCYACQEQFSNSAALHEHIVKHLTVPSIILSRIDEDKIVLQTLKKENEFLQINSDDSKEFNYFKIECIKYEEDIKPELVDIHVDSM